MPTIYGKRKWLFAILLLGVTAGMWVFSKEAGAAFMALLGMAVRDMFDSLRKPPTDTDQP